MYTHIDRTLLTLYDGPFTLHAHCKCLVFSTLWLNYNTSINDVLLLRIWLLKRVCVGLYLYFIVGCMCLPNPMFVSDWMYVFTQPNVCFWLDVCVYLPYVCSWLDVCVYLPNVCSWLNVCVYPPYVCFWSWILWYHSTWCLYFPFDNHGYFIGMKKNILSSNHKLQCMNKRLAFNVNIAK